MASPHFWTLYDRLADDETLEPPVAALIEAALHDDATFEAALHGKATATETNDRPPPGETPRPAGAFLSRLEVEGFRGIGRRVALKITPGPGLTLVVGRNGSGKSSLAEGLEMLLTGDSLRWAGRKPQKEWVAGFRNLHRAGPVGLQATFTVEDRAEPVTLAHHWSADDAVDAGRQALREGTRSLEGLGALGWEEAIQTCRPFLSYDELSTAIDAGPAQLFDALVGLLGVEDVTAAKERLRQARLARGRTRKALRAGQKALVGALEASELDMARQALDCLGRNPDLDTLEELVLASSEAHDDDTVRSLRQLASLAAPALDDVVAVADRVREAVAARADLAQSDAGRAQAAAELLRRALAWRDATDDSTCPVCSTPTALTDAWQRAAEAQVDHLAQAADAARRADADLAAAVDDLRRLVRTTAAPDAHPMAADLGALAARSVWSELPEAPLAMAAHVESHHTRLVDSFTATAQAATERLARLQEAWRPLQRQLMAWLDEARAEADATFALADLQAAENWLHAQEEALRDEAFDPIADQAQQTWELLRQRSNVQLARPRFGGKGKKRGVTLDITVDGAEGVALGVMSQGELHALALSLFLPRLTRPDSPFRFLVVDDPVQAMDPAKVEGLARVLARAATSHQVVVFSHDERLPEAVRRLGLRADIVRVERQANSVVELKPDFGAYQQHLSDASHLVHQRDKLGDELVRTVVPGLCRSALEAALVQRTWQTRLAQGHRHVDIETDLAACQKLFDLAALAFFGSRDAGGQVYERLNRFGRWAGDHVRELNEHSHEPLPPRADLRAFVRHTETLAREVTS